MSKTLKEIRRVDGLSNGSSEIDAIRQINKSKGFISGNDSLSNDKSETATPLAEVKGNDSAPHQPEKATLTAADLEDGQLIVTKDQLMSLIQAGVNKEIQKEKAKVKDIQDNAQAAIEEAKIAKEKAEADRVEAERRLAVEQKQKDAIHKVFNEFGYTAPDSTDAIAPQSYIAPMSTRGGISGKDAFREMNRILDSRSDTPTAVSVNAYTGETFTQRDTTVLDTFVRENKQSCIQGLDTALKAAGLLRGKTAVQLTGKDAPTTRTDVPPAYLDLLSSFMRITHTPKFIHHQFANKVIKVGYNQGDTVQVARVNFAETGVAAADWELTPGTPIVADLQPVTAKSVDVKIKEWGLGKNNTMRPIAIPQFLVATSAIELLAALERNLGHNYNEFQDLALRSLWAATTRVVYNNASAVATTAGGAGSNGQLTYEFLNNLYAYMASLKVPAYMNGYYGIRLNPFALAQLKNSLALQNQYLDKSGNEDITNIFNSATQSQEEKISGYEGTIGNFMIFSSNASGVGASGSEGVQASTRSSYAFGADTITQVTVMPFTIRKSNDDDYGRMEKYTWCSIEGFAALDVDPASTTPASDQQLRVIEVRTSDAKL